MGTGGGTSAGDSSLSRCRQGQPRGRKGGGQSSRSPHGRARRRQRLEGQRRVFPHHALRNGQGLPRQPALRRPGPGRSRVFRQTGGRCVGRLAAFLLKTYDPQDVSDHFSAGDKEYQWRLENVLQEKRTAAQLWDYGLEQTTLYENKIFEVAQEVAKEAGLSLPFGTDAEKRDGIRAVMEYLSKDSPRNDDELLQWYIDAGKRAVEYGREQKLFDIPQDYRLDVTPTPPVLRSTIDAAYYPAPPFKKTGVGRFYLTPTGNDPAALKLNNRASVADTAVHEGFPGHDWHYKYMNQHAAEISNVRWFTPGAVEDSSAMWLDSQSTEGWALYSEELMAEPVEGHPHGFYSAAEHLYELQGQLLRAVRV